MTTQRLATNFTNYTNSLDQRQRVPLVSVVQKLCGTASLFRVIREIRGKLFSVALGLRSKDPFGCSYADLCFICGFILGCG